MTDLWHVYFKREDKTSLLEISQKVLLVFKDFIIKKIVLDTNKNACMSCWYIYIHDYGRKRIVRIFVFLVYKRIIRFSDVNPRRI